jgi:hypothetical protein
MGTSPDNPKPLRRMQGSERDVSKRERGGPRLRRFWLTRFWFRFDHKLN